MSVNIPLPSSQRSALTASHLLYRVLDYKLFTAGQPILDNTLWLHEQLPGYVTSGDVSNYLQSAGYYASYNVAFWPLTFNLSGTAQMVAEYGDYYSYDKTARALIFARDHSKVVDVDSLKKLIRYNDFKRDPLSACPCDPPYTSLFSISTRQDLDDPTGTYEWSFEGFRNHIGIDAKLTSSQLMNNDLQCWAQSGPTHDTQYVLICCRLRCSVGCSVLTCFVLIGDLSADRYFSGRLLCWLI